MFRVNRGFEILHNYALRHLVQCAVRITLLSIWQVPEVPNAVLTLNWAHRLITTKANELLLFFGIANIDNLTCGISVWVEYVLVHIFLLMLRSLNIAGLK